MKKKFYSRRDIVKRLNELGVWNAELTYRRGEGWWLVCDTFDDWISMDSIGAMSAIEKMFERP